MAARRMTDKDSKLDKQSNHLLLLAENQTGYQNLLKIATAAQLDGFYYFPRIDHEFLAKHAEGLIATSGCMAAEIPRAIWPAIWNRSVRKLDWYYEVFGKDNFFLELQQHNIKELPMINKALLDLGPRYQAAISRPMMSITSIRTMPGCRMCCWLSRLVQNWMIPGGSGWKTLRII